MDDDETNQQTNDPAKQFRTLLLAKTKNLSSSSKICNDAECIA